MRKLFKSMVLGLALSAAAGSASASVIQALYLTMDGSGSIDNTEFATQINGYVGALNAVFAAAPTLYGDIAIGGGIFGRNFSQFFPVTAIDDAADLALLTAAIAGLNPGRGGINTGATAIGDAVTASANALLAYETALGVDLRLTIDVTTDGGNNFGSSPVTASEDAINAGLNAVNCLGIGAGANCKFVTTAGSGTDFGTVADFGDLQDALETKILTETGQIPEPSVMALLGIGLLGFAGLRRGQRA
jgi:hypothetical protein